MTELSRQEREAAVQSLQQYFERNMPEPLGNMSAGLLLDFFLQEIGPLVYNMAVADAQTRLQAHLSDLDGDMYKAPFTYWDKTAKRSR